MASGGYLYVPFDTLVAICDSDTSSARRLAVLRAFYSTRYFHLVHLLLLLLQKRLISGCQLA
jgi:hypothetical protein